jgi:hypothetical protein
LIVGGAVGLAVACGFPNPPLAVFVDEPGTDAGDEDSTSSPDVVADQVDTGIEASVEVDAGADVEVDKDAGPIQGAFDGGDAAIAASDAAPVVASTCSDADCDCDNDTFTRVGCGSDAGPKDCDDADGRYRNDQGFLDIVPPAGKTGDWNCDGKEERYFSANETCGGLLTSCAGRQGFQGNPTCGKLGTYVFCKVGGLLNTSCVVDTTLTQTRKQACR